MGPPWVPTAVPWCSESQLSQVGQAVLCEARPQPYPGAKDLLCRFKSRETSRGTFAHLWDKIGNSAPSLILHLAGLTALGCSPASKWAWWS